MRGSAAVVLAATPDFHYVGLIRFFAVLTTVLAVALGRTIARPVLAFVGNFVSHNWPPSLLKRFSFLGDWLTVC